MDKKEFTLGVVVLLSAMQSQASAAGKRMDADGCSLLASTVESAVLRAAGQTDVRTDFQHGKHSLSDIGITTTGPTTCNETTRVTTSAFSAALSKIGMPVDWGYMPPDLGDYCLSHYLDQCYPRLASGYKTSNAKQLSFVHDAWKAVNVGVRTFMPYGTAGDFSSFSPGVLKLSMLGAVASNVEAQNKPTFLLHVERHYDDK